MAALTASGVAQEQSQQEAAPPPRSGLFVRDVSLFTSYYSQGLPERFLQSGSAPVPVGADVATGGSAVLSLAKPGERTNFSLLYTPSYTARIRYSDWNAFSNDLGLTFRHSISTRLHLGLSAAGSIRSREEFQFAPIQTTAIAGAPGDLLDLSRAVSGGTTSSPDMALAAGLYSGDTAAQALLFGSRILASSARFGVDYSITPRLQLTTGIGGSRIQYLRDRRRDEFPSLGVIPQVTSAIGDFGLSYSLSPRTTIGFHSDAARQQSRLDNVVISNARLSLERTMGPHWFVNLSGGVGLFERLPTESPSSRRFQQLAGAVLGYRTNAHTTLVAFNRSVADSYGIAALRTTSVSGSWRWALPRSRAWVDFAVSWLDLQSEIFPATTWRGTAEIGRAIGAGFAIVGSYAYLAYSNLTLRNGERVGQSAIRVSIVWTPAVKLL